MSTRASETALRGAAPVFAALGDETRIRMLARLGADGPLSTAMLGEGIDVTRQAISKHLHVLAGAGLVRASRSGRDSIWTLRPARLAEARRCLERLSCQWDEALERLRGLVEQD